MIINTFFYQKEQGWSIDTFPELDSENTLVLLFCDPEFIDEQTQLKEIINYYPNSKIIGCSASGEIYDSTIKDNAIVVTVAKFEKTQIKATHVNVEDINNSYSAGEMIAKKLTSDDLKSIFVLSEGLNVNGSELTRGLNTINNKSVIITGGLAGDRDRFKKTWTICGDKIKSDCIVGIGFYGDHINIKHGSKGGWSIFGPERRITRAENNVLFELDHKPALGLYKEYLGEKAKDLPASGLLFPLAIRKDENDKSQLVRTILAVNEDDESLTFAGDMPVGYLARLMRANFDKLITGAKEAGEQALIPNKTKTDDPILIIGISCIGRRLLLGERTEEETESIVNIFPANSKLVGFYSYGEISPFTEGNCELHNQTMTLTSIFEETDR